MDRRQTNGDVVGKDFSQSLNGFVRGGSDQDVAGVSLADEVGDQVLDRRRLSRPRAPGDDRDLPIVDIGDLCF